MAERKEERYDWWIVSNNFLKRCFGIWWHYIVANIIIWFITFIIFLILGVSIFSIIVKSNDWFWDSITNSIQTEIRDSINEEVNKSFWWNTEIANPTSMNCIGLGGEIEIVSGENWESWICKKDGKSCEEWALFRGECQL
jgi:putative hemolysin